MAESEPAMIEKLIDRAATGEAVAIHDLLDRFRPRLRQMVMLRMDPRLAARVDGSDVVQETLLIASQRIPEYAESRPLPFYPWLRAIAWNRLVDLHRRHIHSARRSVTRERRTSFILPNDSVERLSDCFAASGTHASELAMRREMNDRVRAALEQQTEADREVLTLRFVEQLSTLEVAAILGISSDSVSKRTVRALRRLRGLLERRLE